MCCDSLGTLYVGYVFMHCWFQQYTEYAMDVVVDFYTDLLGY